MIKITEDESVLWMMAYGDLVAISLWHPDCIDQPTELGKVARPNLDRATAMAADLADRGIALMRERSGGRDD